MANKRAIKFLIVGFILACTIALINFQNLINLFLDSETQYYESADFQAKKQEIMQNLPHLKKGDLIFRRGLGADSVLIQQLQNSHYSHIGIVTSTNPILIIHATTNDDPSRQNQVIQSTLDEFLSRSRKILIKRFDLQDSQREQVVQNAISFLGREFILNDGEDSLYCTTLIEKVFETIKPLNLPYQKVQMLGNVSFLMPKAILDDDKSVQIFQADLE